MNKLFDLNSPFMIVLSRVSDLILVSLLWFLCCIPVITIGPATAALYYVVLKLAKKEEIKVIKGFFHGFKTNFKQAVAQNLIFLVLAAVIVADLWFWIHVQGSAASVITGIFAAAGIWLVCIMMYVYPLQAQFINPVKNTFKNAGFLAMRHVLSTVIILALHLLPLIVAFISLELFVLTIPLWVLFAPGLIAYLCAFRFNKIFAPYLPTTENTELTES